MNVVSYTVRGRREPDAPVVILSSGLGGAASYWAPQFELLDKRFRVVTYDHRGTGANHAELPIGHSITDMADDVLAVLDELGVAHATFMGHALGGLIGLQVALRRPSALERLVLVNAWARADVHTAHCFAMRKEVLKHLGVASYVRLQPLFLYPATWLSRHSAWIEREEMTAIERFPGVGNTLTRIQALLDFDVEERLASIEVPTLVAASCDDLLVPYTCSRALVRGLPNARLVVAPHGGHAYNVVRPAIFARHLLDFLGNRVD